MDSALALGRRPGEAGVAGTAAAVVVDLALEDPALDADRARRGERLVEAVVDVGAQRVQGDATLAVPLAAAHLGVAEATGRVDADALGAELHRGLHGPLERAAER